MRTLGINCGHDSSLAIAEDGKVIFAIEEERLNGFKKFHGFPAKSLYFGLRHLGLTEGDFDKVIYSQKGNFFFRPTEPYIESKNPFPNATYNDHHYSHAVSAYCWSGFDECVVMTLDGGGDNKFGSIYEGKDGKLNLVAELKLDKYPFGIFYLQVTALCGFTPNRHEGKIMGLAARGNPKGMFDGMFSVEGTQIKSIGGMLGEFNPEPIVENRLDELYWSKGEKPATYDIAADAQLTFERIVLQWIENNAKGRNLAVSGGSFANVLCNMKIAKMVKRLYVAPPMFDDGISIGAALSGFDPLPSYKQEHMYLGFESGTNPANIFTAGQVASMVQHGLIVGLCHGRMEFGPRALGNRSILADPRDVGMNAYLNKKLNRTEFMPFAPVILEEYADEILEDFQTGIDNAPFMTNCWKVRENWKDKIPAVVHIDGTVRPQVIKRDINPFYYDIIDEYRKLTGIPVLINTSFNAHEDPIVCFNNEAEWARKMRRIDILVEAK